MSKKFIEPAYASAALPDITVKCGKCKQEFPHLKPSKVRGYRVLIQSEDRPAEYAASRIFYCDECIEETIVEVGHLTGVSLDKNSPLAQLRVLNCKELDMHNERVREAINHSGLYKRHELMEDDVPLYWISGPQLKFPLPKKKGRIRRFLGI